jgi:predicted nuclease of predicted toxin-antitoxin system
MEKCSDNYNIALLIDAENISSEYAPLIIDEANKYGKITYRRIYGDWTTNTLNKWKTKCIELGLTPVQQYTYVSKKNSSDFTLIIDAMDILYREKVDCFCIVTSDSDFTKLVIRLKEDNMYVFGMGESKTPTSLVNACEHFAYLDKMNEQQKEEEKVIVEVKEVKPIKEKSRKKVVESSITPIPILVSSLKTIIDDNLTEQDWAYWSKVADLFQKKYPGFHPRNYGYRGNTKDFFQKHGFVFTTFNTATTVSVKK